jgi:hypothetical protein
VRRASADAPLPALRLGGLIVFGAPPRGLVLARQVVVGEALLTLHARIHAAVDETVAGREHGHENGRDDGGHDDAPPVAVIPHTRPGSWTPHVTLALRLTAEQLGLAVAALGHVDPLDAPVAGLRRWDPRDHTTTELA